MKLELKRKYKPGRNYNPPLDSEDWTEYELFLKLEEIKAAQRFQKENPEISYTFGGIPVGLFTIE
jgi:hypothetical protein